MTEPAWFDPGFNEGRLVTEIPNSSLPKLLMFRDSYANALIPFLSEHFRRAVYLWQYEIDPDLVAAEQPDIVIHEWAGRRLMNHGTYNAVADERSRGKLPELPRLTATSHHHEAASDASVVPAVSSTVAARR